MSSEKHEAHGEEMIEFARAQLIGSHDVISTPFGKRKLTYADYVASGRSIAYIEDYITNEVLPYYANTHTTSSFTGQQSMHFREEARRIIGSCCNYNPEEDVVIFGGRGVTGVINLLAHALRIWPKREVAAINRPVLFIGPQEHHSNILPWRESTCDVIMITEHPETGVLDLEVLEKRLIEFKDRPLRIASFSACSNITGLLLDPVPVTELLHKYGALSFWDYAAAGPYTEIDMNPAAEDEATKKLRSKDAIFISPHKFIGGPGTPGVLVAKRKLFDSHIAPTIPGGGTVQFVTKQIHCYLNDIAEREEAGTPDIIGCIRAGLTFQFKQAIGHDAIMKREHYVLKRTLERWAASPYIQVLGPATMERLTTMSFLIWHQSGRMMNYNFVAQLLNDLFGIQARGGCACAGPYGIWLLDICDSMAAAYKELLVDRAEFQLYRPGFTRVNLHFVHDEHELEYIISAVEFIAREGWKLMPLYKIHNTDFHHVDLGKVDDYTQSLSNISITASGVTYPKRSYEKLSTADLKNYLVEAQEIVDKAVKRYKKEDTLAKMKAEFPGENPEAAKLRWFVLPHEAFDKNVDIDEVNNYRNPEWRKKVLENCAYVPRVYTSMAEVGKKGVPDALRKGNATGAAAAAAAPEEKPAAAAAAAEKEEKKKDKKSKRSSGGEEEKKHEEESAKKDEKEEKKKDKSSSKDKEKSSSKDKESKKDKEKSSSKDKESKKDKEKEKSKSKSKH